ncbi:aldehyde dehydrogenase family protein [Thalassococcus sp. BH17M4-6]|uniref:aldehyde dehydrogenase family protein n=1 Tax=Thalassococcus sp. BH17M4-6 TaxID=3413148 RepID=UPI003BDF2E6C
MNQMMPPVAAGRHDIAAIIGNRVQPVRDSFDFDGWTIPAATSRDIAMALKSARNRPANDLSRVVEVLAQVGRDADWITDADMDLISARVGCTRSYLGESMARLNAWLAEIPAFVARLGTPGPDGYRTDTGLWRGGLSTTLVLAGDASALGPLALSHMLLSGSRTIAKGSKYEPLAPTLFLRRLMEYGLQVPDLLYIDTAAEDATTLTARLIGNTAQSVIYGADATLQTIYGSAEVAMTHKKIAFLSGRSGAVVLDDADPETAARIVLKGVAEDRGNRCYSTKKVFVPQAMMPAFLGHLTRQADALTRGAPEHPATDIGRLASDGRRVTDMKIGGSKVLYDTDILVVEAGDDDALLLEEMPYPVCAVRPYGDDEDPVALFNRSSQERQGHTALAVSVITQDAALFETAARSLNATKVLHSKPTIDIDHHTSHQGLYLFRELMRFKEICA